MGDGEGRARRESSKVSFSSSNINYQHNGQESRQEREREREAERRGDVRRGGRGMSNDNKQVEKATGDEHGDGDAAKAFPGQSLF